MNSNFFKFKKSPSAFTLAETLIALAILGILAAISVPSLIANAKKQEYVSGLKKSYLTISSISQKITADNGGSLDGAWNQSWNAGWADRAFKDAFIKYASVQKSCISTSLNPAQEGCWAPNVTNLYNENSVNLGSGGAILADGSFLNFSSNWSGANFDPNKCNATNLITNDGCGSISVDVNGFSEPNKLGRDIFIFVLRKDGKIIPFGTLEAPAPAYRSCGSNPNDGNNNGYSCAARIMKESWEMSY